jgi:Predicted Co/Zn/Cd cation transporters
MQSVSTNWEASGLDPEAVHLVYRYTQYINADLDSTALTALAHDCLNDIYTSAAAVIGVTGVLVDIPVLDPLAGAIVSLLVIYQGYEIASENIPYVVGAAPSGDQRDSVESMLRSDRDVRGFHDLTVYYDGTDLEVEVHIEVSGELTLQEAHTLETRLVRRLRENEDVGDVHLHLDPSGIGEWKQTPE